jgi:hypothetical protein
MTASYTQTGEGEKTSQARKFRPILWQSTEPLRRAILLLQMPANFVCFTY